ncbi:transcription antitermination protein NusB [Synechococcus sp. BL107]|nr:transcription antitermination protein NusB [Synechococcus sp. BL107]
MDLAQDSAEQHLQAVVVQRLVNLALKGVPQEMRPRARTN